MVGESAAVLAGSEIDGLLHWRARPGAMRCGLCGVSLSLGDGEAMRTWTLDLDMHQHHVAPAPCRMLDGRGNAGAVPR